MVRHCQKCAAPIQPHDEWRCVGCKLTCCINCVQLLKTVGQAIRCHECAAINRQKDIDERKRRLAGAS